MNIFRKLEQYWQHPLLYWPLVILIAAATPFTFAPYYHFWLMPLLFGALIRLIELRPRFAVMTAYLFGLIGYTAQFYWIHTALHDVSGLPDSYAIPLTFLLPAFLALYPAICFLGVEKMQPVALGQNRPPAADFVDAGRICPRTFPDWIRLGCNRLFPNHQRQPVGRLRAFGRHSYGHAGNRFPQRMAGVAD